MPDELVEQSLNGFYSLNMSSHMCVPHTGTQVMYIPTMATHKQQMLELGLGYALRGNTYGSSLALVNARVTT